MTLTTGSSLGPYRIVDKLGAGGMGEVYRAQDTRLDREVAVKVLPTHLISAPEARQRFEREARSASSLNHPNICTVHDIGSHEGVDYLVMELLDGETLAERLARGAMPMDELLAVAIPLADALSQAHRSGLIHRDLKPGNVMLTKGGAKLMDFGLAKGLEASSPSDLTSTPTLTSPLTAAGMILGTFQYMAPEQLEGKPADARSDIFAFGTMLHEMATGMRAFQGETQAALIASILKEEPPAVSETRPASPMAFDHVVARCLAKSPEARWQTVSDLSAELQWSASGKAPAEGSPGATTQGHRQTAMPGWAWGVMALLGVVLFAAGWLLHRPAAQARSVVRSSVLLPGGLNLDTSNKSLALSPDGSSIAYTGTDSEGRSGIWVRRLDGLNAQHLAGTEGATYPFWSPDSRTLGFFADRKLRKIPASGGTAQTICDAPDGRGAGWGADGLIVFAPQSFGGLFQVAAAGGTPTPATVEERADWTHRNPHFLPDGKRLLYFAGSPEIGMTGAIHSLDVTTGETAEVLEENSEGIFVEPGYVAFVREGNLMVQPMDRRSLQVTGEAVPLVEDVQFNNFRWTGTYSFSATGLLLYRSREIETERQLTWFDLEGNELGTVGDPAGFWVSLEISPDGRRAVSSVRQADGKSDLWIHDLERNVSSKFTFGDVAAVAGFWSPDGTQIAFSDGGGRILVKAADGSGTHRTVTTEGILPWGWTPDGTQVLVMQQSNETQLDLALVPVSGDEPPTPIVATAAAETLGAFSPDGRWLAYLSDESGRNELYVVAYPGPGGKWQVSRDGAQWFEWLPDGSGVLYVNPQSGSFRVPLIAQGTNLEIGAAQSVAIPTTGSLLTTNGSLATLAPDGKRLLAGIPVSGGGASALTLVQHWADELE
jgi:serine/threonine protein kinase/WD40 repeat protein